jgi:hypothetical protein
MLRLLIWSATNQSPTWLCSPRLSRNWGEDHAERIFFSLSRWRHRRCAWTYPQKAELYARAGIPDYWVLDVDKRRMIVHRNPASGKYTSIIVYAEHESVSPLAAPECEIRVASTLA